MSPHHAVALLRCYGPVDFMRASARLCECVVRRRVLGQRYVRRRIFDYTLDLDLHDPGVSKELAIFAKRELEHRWILERVLRPGMVAWDLGANIGYYAIMEAQLVGPTGAVYAVEPSPANVALLRRNVAVNGVGEIVRIEEAAISNRNGDATFHLSERSNVHTLHPRVYGANAPAHLTGATVTVRVVDVPTFLLGKRPVDLVRMDIEGHEVEVFASIADVVRAGMFRAAILFETHLPKYDHREHDIAPRLRELAAQGYRPTVMASTDERRAHFRGLGYSPEQVVWTDGVARGIYRDVRLVDAIALISERGGVRTVLLERA